MSKSNEHVMLAFITLVILLLLIPSALGVNVNEALIPSHGIIDFGIDTCVRQFENGTYYVETISDGVTEIVYANADADSTINYAIGLSVGGTVFVVNIGSDYEINNPIRMKTGVTLLFDNNVRITQTAQGNTITFSGSSSNRVTHAHVDSLGRATLYGGSVFMNYANNCSIRNVEITNTPSTLIELRYADYNILENIYGHKYSVSGSSSHGILINGATRNKILNCTVDAEKQATSRSALMIWGGYSDTSHNEVIGGEFKNSATDNGIYVCSGEDYSADYTTIIGVRVSGNQADGHSGIKIRPSSYNIVTDFISENNHNGMEMGTYMSSGDHYLPNSTGNIIKGVLRNNDMVGLVLYTDGDGYSVSGNSFQIIVENNGNHGIWMTDGGNSNTDIAFNNISVTCIGNSRSGIYFDVGGSSYIWRNNISGIFADNGESGIYVGGANCVDNRFDVIAANNTSQDIRDTGTRTRINGAGKEAAGVGNSPTASLWDIGNIVKNTDDGTSWIKDADGTMKSLTKLTAKFATYTPFNSSVMQFIDEGYDPDGSVVAWSWAFGDGSTSIVHNPKHEYAIDGNYTVSLTVTDDDDNVDTIMVVVSVKRS